jgi:hypothetical protein
MTKGYKIIKSEYREPADIAGRMRPERVTWVEWEVREYPNGDQIRFERQAARWAGTYAPAGDWVTEGVLEAGRLANELYSIRKNLALFFETTKHPGRAPFPPVEGAPGPSPHPETWREYLEAEAAKAPRIKACMYPDDCAKAWADYNAGKTDKVWGGACGYCRAKHAKEIAALCDAASDIGGPDCICPEPEPGDEPPKTCRRCGAPMEWDETACYCSDECEGL